MRVLLLILVVGTFLLAHECVCPETEEGVSVPEYLPEPPKKQFYDDEIDDSPEHTPDDEDAVYA